jgi:hypothetical protein
MKAYMKPTTTLFGILTITAALAMDSQAQVQVYQFSTPISGYLTMGAYNWYGVPEGSVNGNFSGTFMNYFSNLSETVYLDPVNETLRQVGTITYTPSATNIQFQETQTFTITITNSFPNTDTYTNVNVSGDVTVNLALNGGVLSFDTGPIGLESVGDGDWDINLFARNQILPCSGSYSLVTGGQTLSGSFSYYLDLETALGFNVLSTTEYPSSIQLSGGGVEAEAVFPAAVVANVQATNGFTMTLAIGTFGFWGYGGYEMFDWSLPSVTATNVAYGEPSISNQPQSVVVDAYNTASFSVAATGALPLSYQWSFDGSNISGATASILTIPNVAQTNLGTYAVVVANSFGTNTSSNAVLSMYPVLATPFGGLVTNWGYNATLSVGAWGTGPLSYQWFENGAAISGATNDTFELASIQFTNAGLYSVVVSSVLGSVTNTPEQVVVNPAGLSLGLAPTLTIMGVVGYSYIIQSTADLANTNSWVTLTNLTLTQLIQLYVDTNTDASLPGNPQRFYRVLPGQ